MKLKCLRIKIGLALSISILIHFALGMLFVINWKAAGQFKRVHSHDIVIDLSAISTIGDLTPQSNDTKAIKQQLKQPVSKAQSETVTALTATAPTVKSESKLPMPKQTDNTHTEKKPLLTKHSPSNQESVPLAVPPVAETTTPASSKKIATKSTLKAALPNSAIITNPVYRKWNKPVYPRRSIAKNQQGNVLVDARIDTRGRVIDIEIHKSSGYPLLDRSAVKSVKNWVFEPVKRYGVKTDAMVRVPVNFILAQR